ncbi:MAG TPA: 50S ribosomal protein L27 [Polyangiaceae bacterium LLY-WYZ-14_1]|jgi:large subunit ribosomal protein L27|nr:50S ribosomal protein L27 [Polyangiaceae bacterium LLY-WYZ-14_1]
MAHKKGQGSSRNGRDSNPKYRGVKVFGGQQVHAGSILVRQSGSVFHAGSNVGTGSDFTLWARVDGTVRFERWGKRRKRVAIDPLPAVVAPEAPAAPAPSADPAE